uniref:Uncharacterized protein n=1 Tax=Arundo donax TaxID=35708 RepID=A0A0A9H2I5_ARUDO
MVTNILSLDWYRYLAFPNFNNLLCIFMVLFVVVLLVLVACNFWEFSKAKFMLRAGQLKKRETSSCSIAQA